MTFEIGTEYTTREGKSVLFVYDLGVGLYPLCFINEDFEAVWYTLDGRYSMSSNSEWDIEPARDPSEEEGVWFRNIWADGTFIDEPQFTYRSLVKARQNARGAEQYLLYTLRIDTNATPPTITIQEDK